MTCWETSIKLCIRGVPNEPEPYGSFSARDREKMDRFTRELRYGSFDTSKYEEKKINMSATIHDHFEITNRKSFQNSQI